MTSLSRVRSEDYKRRLHLRQAVGIDIGGTKIAAGVVDVASGSILERETVATRPERGGEAVLADCGALARGLGDGTLPVGIGLCELVGLDGRAESADTIDWRGVEVAAAFEAPAVVLESDVRAAARAESRFGAGAGRSPFLYVTVGTGTSACLMIDGKPYAGARGHAITLGAPPVERIASGPALARRAGLERAEAVLADPAYAALVDDAAAALGQVLAVLCNILDPELVVIGGGLGAEPSFRDRVAAATRALIEYEGTRGLEIVGAKLGVDAGVVGAALAALD
jgi:glucokinase